MCRHLIRRTSRISSPASLPFASRRCRSSLARARGRGNTFRPIAPRLQPSVRLSSGTRAQKARTGAITCPVYNSVRIGLMNDCLRQSTVDAPLFCCCAAWTTVNGTSPLPQPTLDISVFQLLRGPHWWIGYGWSGCNVKYDYPDGLKADYGVPLSTCLGARRTYFNDDVYVLVFLNPLPTLDRNCTELGSFLACLVKS